MSVRTREAGPWPATTGFLPVAESGGVPLTSSVTCSGGELAVARSVGFPPERIVFHGNAKTPRELREAGRRSTTF